MNPVIGDKQPCVDLFFCSWTKYFYSLTFISLKSYFQVHICTIRSVSNLPMPYKERFTLLCFRPCVLCWVYCGQWSALPSCWQAHGCSLWACCPSTPYHRSIDLLLQVPASASVPSFFMSLPVSPPPCLFPPSALLSDPLSSFLHFYLSTWHYHRLSLLVWLHLLAGLSTCQYCSPLIVCLNLASCLALVFYLNSLYFLVYWLFSLQFPTMVGMNFSTSFLKANS